MWSKTILFFPLDINLMSMKPCEKVEVSYQHYYSFQGHTKRTSCSIHASLLQSKRTIHISLTYLILDFSVPSQALLL